MHQVPFPVSRIQISVSKKHLAFAFSVAISELSDIFGAAAVFISAISICCVIFPLACKKAAFIGAVLAVPVGLVVADTAAVGSGITNL